MTALVNGFISGATSGWLDRLTVGSFAVAVALLTLLVLLERRHPSPLLPLTLLADRQRAFAYLNVALLPATMLGTFYFLTQYFQSILGLSPLSAGLAFLPLTGSMFAVVRLVPRLLSRTGPRQLMIAGAAVLTVGVGWLSRLTPDSGYLDGVLWPLFTCGIGIGLSFMPLNLTILSGVPATDSGAASGLLQAMQLAGASLGLAVLAAAAATGDDLLGGITAAFTMATGLAVLALLVAAFGIRPSRQSDQHGRSGQSAA
jgi:predicted MFS family arabinose efflux permease